MKKMASIVLAIVVATMVSQAQNAPVEKSVTDMKAEVAALQARLAEKQTAEATFASKFVGFGREIGAAMNGCVEALDGGMKVTTARLNEFAQTDVGKFAMIGIGWKIFADDILKMIGRTVETILGLFLFVIFFVILRHGLNIFFFGKMVVTKKDGPWYNRTITKERSVPLYKQLSSASEEQEALAGWLGAIILVSLIVTMWTAIAFIM